MASSDPNSLRNRFLTPKVARSLTDAPAIGAVGVGAAAAILVGLGPIGAVVGGAAFLAGRVAVAIPKKANPKRGIDPYRLGDPWRRLVRDAMAAERQFDTTVKGARDGPLRDELHAIGSRIDESLLQCWQIAQGGNALSQARARIDVYGAQRDLAEVQASEQNDTTAHTIEALQAQLATAARMDTTITETRDKLRLLNARLDEAVSRSIELSATSAGSDQLQLVGDDVASIVGEMESLRQAIEVVGAADRSLPDRTQPDRTQPG
jgi:hypothetical protein